MNANDLKVTAGKAVVESRLTKQSKLQLLNFLEGATPHQVKAFLLDGEIIGVPDEYTKEIIDARFSISEIEPVTAAAVAGMGVAGAAITDKKARQACAKYKGTKDYRKCLNRYIWKGKRGDKLHKK
jgi:hypothetical protein